MRLKRTVALLLLLLSLPMLTGCWDRAEVEEQAFVLAIGIDKGETSQYAVTAAIAIPGKLAGGDKGGGGGGGGKEEKPYMMTTVEAPTMANAMGMIGSYVGRKVSLLHTKALFMGEELARISGMHTMDEFVRFRQARRSVFYIVTKGKASEFLDKMDPELEKDPQKFIEQLTLSSRDTGMIPPHSQIQTYVTTANTGYSQPITYYVALREEDEEEAGGEQKPTPGRTESGFDAGELPRTGGPNIELIGAAAFKGEKMVGVLSGTETRLILMMQDAFRRGAFSVPDPKRPDLFVGLDVRPGRPLQITVDLTQQRPQITAMVALEGEIVAMQSGVDYTEPELQPVLEDAVSERLESQFRSLVAKTQGWEADVIGFGRSVVKQFPTVAAWERFDWPNKYANSDVQIQVRFTLRRFGVQLSPPEARE